jgi:hypothetical protein
VQPDSTADNRSGGLTRRDSEVYPRKESLLIILRTIAGCRRAASLAPLMLKLAVDDPFLN